MVAPALDPNAAAPSPQVEIDVAVQSSDWPEQLPGVEDLCRDVAERAVRSELNGFGASDSPIELSILLADDEVVRELNARHRQRDNATNVLSFPMHPIDAPVASGQMLLLGDVVLAFETVCREAAQKKRTIDAHLSHLLVHGVLHLLGYDHLEDDDAKVMEQREIALLLQMGVANPYEDESGRVEAPK